MTDRDNQHFLPRFILKGFYSRRKKKEFYTWVFSNKSKVPYESNIKKIGAEHHFYKEEKDKSDLDDNITKNIEPNSSKCIEELRKQSFSRKLIDEVEILKKFIHFQIFRTKNARYFVDTFIKAGIDMLDFNEIVHKIMSSEECKRLCLEEGKKNGIKPEEIKKLFFKCLINQREKFHSFISFPEKDKKYFDRIKTNIHNSALSSSINKIENSPFLQHLNWYLFISDKEELILGDSCCFSKDLNGKFGVWVNSKDDLYQVILPISNTHLIVGSKECTNSVDFEEINFGACSCSKEFFISSKNTEREIEYKKHIGASNFISDWGNIFNDVS